MVKNCGGSYRVVVKCEREWVGNARQAVYDRGGKGEAPVRRSRSAYRRVKFALITTRFSFRHICQAVESSSDELQLLLRVREDHHGLLSRT